MMRITHALVMLAAGGLLGALLSAARPREQPASPSVTLGQLQQVAELALLRVPVTELHVQAIDGYLGGVRCVLIIHGQVVIGCDVTQARMEIDDHGAYRVILPPPRVLDGRVDLDRTRIYQIDREGLWCLLPGAAGEHRLLERALAQAQTHVASAVQLDQHDPLARHRIEQLLMHLAHRLHVVIHVAWL
jgi:hypothetical protein